MLFRERRYIAFFLCNSYVCWIFLHFVFSRSALTVQTVLHITREKVEDILLSAVKGPFILILFYFRKALTLKYHVLIVRAKDSTSFAIIFCCTLCLPVSSSAVTVQIVLWPEKRG